jgi:hypothetical protein
MCLEKRKLDPGRRHCWTRSADLGVPSGDTITSYPLVVMCQGAGRCRDGSDMQLTCMIGCGMSLEFSESLTHVQNGTSKCLEICSQND